MLKKLQERYKEIMDRLKEIRAMKVEDLTEEIRKERDDLLKEVEQVVADIDAEKRADDLEKRNLANPNNPNNTDPDDDVVNIEDQPIYRGTPAAAFGQQLVDVAVITSNRGGADNVKAAQDRLEQNTKRALALIEKQQGQKPSKDFTERSMRPIYEARAAGTGQIQSVGSEGGFLLQSETSIDLMTHGFNNSEILRRCQRRTLTGSESLEIVGIDETSRADGSRGGGVRVYTDAELSQISSSMTKFEKIKLSPERLTGMYYASDKILMNATFLGQEMRQLFMEEFAFKTQDLVMAGTGAGQALGIKNADCKISITKETGQAADTIVAENVLKMFERFYLRGGAGSVGWFANRNCFFQLYTMTYDIGTGGEMARLYVPPRNPGETGSMLGYPLVFVEQAETLGDAGDIWLCDWSQYVCVDYGNINEASSIHFKFDYAQTTFRFVYYFDGQPRMVSAITPYKGGSSYTVSPFVRIAAR